MNNETKNFNASIVLTGAMVLAVTFMGEVAKADSNKDTPFVDVVEAIREKNVGKVKRLLLKHSNILVNEQHYMRKDGSETTLLYWTMTEGIQVDVARILLENGADTNRDVFYGDTALHMAVRLGKSPDGVKMVKLLLEYGADVNMRNSSGKTPMDIAAEKLHDREDVFFILDAHGGIMAKTTFCKSNDTVVPENYEGGCKGTYANGHGKSRGKRGKYEGNFRNGLRHGHGVMKYYSGATYIGQFKNGRISGFGRYTNDLGQVHQGYWQNGTMKRKVRKKKFKLSKYCKNHPYICFFGAAAIVGSVYVMTNDDAMTRVKMCAKQDIVNRGLEALARNVISDRNAQVVLSSALKSAYKGKGASGIAKEITVKIIQDEISKRDRRFGVMMNIGSFTNCLLK